VQQPLALQQAAFNIYGGITSAAVGRAAAARGIGGDFAFHEAGTIPSGQPLRFTIVNQGPCSVGPARHAVFLMGGFDPVLEGFVETPDLAPGEAADLTFDVPAGPNAYRIDADFDDDESETNESNNLLALSVLPPVFGTVAELSSPTPVPLPPRRRGTRAHPVVPESDRPVSPHLDLY